MTWRISTEELSRDRSGPLHRGRRLSSETSLQRASEWVAEPAQDVTRARECSALVLKLVRRTVPPNEEAFLARFDMAGQRAVCEAESCNRLCGFIDHVND